MYALIILFIKSSARLINSISGSKFIFKTLNTEWTVEYGRLFLPRSSSDKNCCEMPDNEAITEALFFWAFRSSRIKFPIIE